MRHVALAMLALGPLACDRPAPESSTGPQADVVTAEPVTAGLCEHGVVADLCPKCIPSLEAVFRAKGDWCDEHGFARSRCPQCAPETGRERLVRELEQKVVRFADPDLERAAGIRAVAARTVAPSEEVHCSGHLEFDADRVAEVRAAVPGVVRRVAVSLGAAVEPGEALFELDSQSVGEARADALAAAEAVRVAEQQLRRQQELEQQSIASRRQVELARGDLAAVKARLAAAETTLRMAGAGRERTSGRYTLTAPIAGTVVARSGIVGSLATRDEALATIADTSVMWALCHVPEAALGRVRLGQTMRLFTEATPQPAIAGPVSWIDAKVDARTRMVAVRAEIANADGNLRAEQFVRGQIVVGAGESGVSVPRAAIQRVGEHEVVFVRTQPGVYETRRVERRGGGDPVTVAGNVHEGDAVVTTGAVLLRTEIMPGSIGAGCCEVTPPSGH